MKRNKAMKLSKQAKQKLNNLHREGRIKGPIRIIWEPSIAIAGYGIVYLTHQEMQDVLIVAQGYSPRTRAGFLYQQHLQNGGVANSEETPQKGYIGI